MHSCKPREVPFSSVISVRLSACLNVAPTEGLFVKFNNTNLQENGSKIPNCFKTEQKYRALHEDLSVFRTVRSDICSATIHRRHRYASMTKVSVPITSLTAAYVRQRHKGNAFLLFHVNSAYANAPSCYVVLTLLT